MEFLNLLSGDVGIAMIGRTFDISLNWIGKLIRLLTDAVGSVGVGIILFSVILKLIVLPFDIYQRIAMRKQNIKMKENQKQMEKLQKQYANDKDTYNKKVMEMYQKSGISMFSSCLPMILSMVIFFVAIDAFNAYAQYANVNNYNIMVNAYNTEISTYCADLEEKNITVDGDYFIVKDEAPTKIVYYKAKKEGEITDTQKYIKSAKKEYYIDVEKAYKNEEIKAFADALMNKNTEMEKGDAVSTYLKSEAQNAVVKAYNDKVIHNTKFGWIKNIWATDASYKHPILEFNEFKSEVSREKFSVGPNRVTLNTISTSADPFYYTDAYHADTYNMVTAKLTTQKTQANGYYILILLSIATILLQQWVSMLGQKEQQKYSSVDGQGASQQKMTMIIMTVMFAIFSFMYSSAFSIYMITSNLLSLVSTLVINKAVDASEEKREQKKMQEQYNKRFPGRVAPDSDNNKKKQI
ncbi:MAG: YidC/Oxa1 family membrane protein insertase [Clostridia bacterium]|nr:YidC/Oxa1 family membrane protein insertase [Clostridia bacterium]